MKKKILLFLALVAAIPLLGQRPYWQQKLHYLIDVSLNDTQHTLDGFLKLTYENHSPDTLHFIWFHLWPNAYKNDKTAFSEQMLENGKTNFYFSNKEQRGYINQLDFRVANRPCKTEDHPQYIDVVKVFLPTPLAPGAQTEISTPFHVQLPENFSRGGHKGQSYQITQWYPKPAVYDAKGWHPMPYLDQGEFYSEFGNFDVRISLPENYAVAAPGQLQNENEKTWLKQRASFRIPAAPAPTNVKKKWGEPVKKSASPAIVSSSTSKTLRYLSDNVHDFAWFADKTYIVNHDTAQLASGRVIDVYSFYTLSGSSAWVKSVAMMKKAIHFRSALLGEYPYPSVTGVEAAMGFAGGMEYPGITSLSPELDAQTLDITLQHEIGHNWFYAILATNERDHPWLDEGLNAYYDSRYEQLYYPESADPRKSPLSSDVISSSLSRTLVALHKDQPIATSSADFTLWNYQFIAYGKTADWLRALEKQLGRPLFDQCMKAYYEQWKFKHPYPEDFLSVLELQSGQALPEFRKALTEKHTPFPAEPEKKSTKTAFLVKLNPEPGTRYISFLPLGGRNFYDGMMLGAGIHNYTLPPSPFRFFLLPQYAFKSKQVNGIGRLQYTTFPEGKIAQTTFFLNGSRYSQFSGIDSNGKRISGSFDKIVPGVRILFREPSARSTRERGLEWKTFLIGERGFRFDMKSTDSLFYPARADRETRYLNQLTYFVTNYRALYPYEVRVQVQQGKDFYRASVTGNYFFNYPGSGGLNLRFFAAKFGYIGGKTSRKQFDTYRFQPKLTAVRGNEDYTYSDYFMGRNETEGIGSQQIMMRDGGLKLRTDLFQDLQGRSDNWVASVNFNTTIPASILPKFIPLRIFFDAGTYAEAWKKESATTRFLFVGGLQLSLFKEVINIYAPLFYSSSFRNNLKSVPEENKFFRKVSFTIDLQRFSLRKWTGNQFPF